MLAGHAEHVALAVVLGLLEEGAAVAAAEVVEGRLGEQLAGVQAHEELGVPRGGRHQRFQDVVDDVKDLRDKVCGGRFVIIKVGSKGPMTYELTRKEPSDMNFFLHLKA